MLLLQPEQPFFPPSIPPCTPLDKDYFLNNKKKDFKLRFINLYQEACHLIKKNKKLNY
jgi:hypothetical protein